MPSKRTNLPSLVTCAVLRDWIVPLAFLRCLLYVSRRGDVYRHAMSMNRGLDLDHQMLPTRASCCLGRAAGGIRFQGQGTLRGWACRCSSLAPTLNTRSFRLNRKPQAQSEDAGSPPLPMLAPRRATGRGLDLLLAKTWCSPTSPLLEYFLFPLGFFLVVN